MTKLHVSFILDETGSMISVKDATISGFNEYITKLKNDKSSKNALFTLTKFNSAKVQVVYDGVALDWVAPLNGNTYVPDELTPLYDAVGKTIRSLEAKLVGKKKQHALVIIQTDGEENASKEYTREAIFKLIEEKKKLGWAFAFLGADQDAYQASQKMGIPVSNTLNYKSGETQSAFAVQVTSMTTSYTRSGGHQTGNLVTPVNTVKDTEDLNA
jgi:uncharacterized protein YegL